MFIFFLMNIFFSWSEIMINIAVQMGDIVRSIIDSSVHCCGDYSPLLL